MDISQIASLITALRAETEKGAITPDSLGYILKLMCDFMESLQPTVLPDDVSIALSNLQSELETQIEANEKSIMTAQREVSSLRTQHNSDLQTKMDSDVWNFSGFVEVASADITNGSAPETAGVLFNRTTNSFVFFPIGVTEASYYNNKAGAWNGKATPSSTLLYKDTTTGTLYRWDGTALTALADEVYAGYKQNSDSEAIQTREGFLERLAKYIDNQGARTSYFSEVSDDEYLNFGQLKQAVGGADSSFSMALFNGSWGKWYLGSDTAFGTILGSMNSGLATTLAASGHFITSCCGTGTSIDNWTVPSFAERLAKNYKFAQGLVTWNNGLYSALASYASFGTALATNTALCRGLATQSEFLSAVAGMGTSFRSSSDNYTSFINRLLDNAHYNASLANNLIAPLLTNRMFYLSFVSAHTSGFGYIATSLADNDSFLYSLSKSIGYGLSSTVATSCGVAICEAIIGHPNLVPGTTFINNLLTANSGELQSKLAAMTAFVESLGGNTNLVVALGKNPGFSSSLSDENIRILGGVLAANTAFVAAMKSAMV